MDIPDTEEEKGLLRDEESDSWHRPRFQPKSTTKQRRFTWFDAYFLLIHVLLLSLLVALVFLMVAQASDSEEYTICMLIQLLLN